jgi:hypothetical protein
VEKFVSSLKKLKVHDFVAHQQSSFLKKQNLHFKMEKLLFWGISQKIVYLLFRMLHKDFTGITNKPPFIPFLAILKILGMSWKTYTL